MASARLAQHRRRGLTGTYPAGLAMTPDGSAVYAANNGSANVSVISTVRRGAGGVEETARSHRGPLSRFTFQFDVVTDYDLARSLGIDSRAITAATTTTW